jgi:hypothetical protein
MRSQMQPGTIPGPSRPAGDYEEPLLHVVGLDKAPSSERRLVSELSRRVTQAQHL